MKLLKNKRAEDESAGGWTFVKLGIMILTLLVLLWILAYIFIFNK